MKIMVTKKEKRVIEHRRVILTVPTDVIVKELGVSRQDVWNWNTGRSFPCKKYLAMLEKLEAEYPTRGKA